MGRFNMDFREKTSLNILTNMMRTVAMALIGIFMTPYYLDSLGMAAYAIIPLATTMASYIQIVSDSMAYATVRFNTLAFNSNDENEINKTFSSSFFGLGRICLILVPIAVVVSIISPVVFDITGNAASEVQIMFILILLSSFLVTHSVTFNGVFYSTNDLYILYLIKFSYSIGQIGVIIFLFTIGTPSLIDIGIGYFVASAAIYIAMVIWAKRLFPCLKIRRAYFDRELFKQMGSLGIWSVISKVGGMLYIELSIVLVNMYLGSEEEGGFALAATALSMINTACYTITGSIDPFIYKYYAEKKEKELVQTLYTGTKFTTVMIAFPTLFIIVFSEEFLNAWVGSEYTYLTDIIIIGCLGNLAYCSVAAMTGLARTYMRIKPTTVMTLALGLVNAVLLVLLLPTDMGSVEMAITIWALCTAGLAVFNSAYDAYLTHSKLYKYLICTAIGYAILLILYYPLELLRTWINIPGEWIPLIVTAMITYVIYLLIAYILLFSRTEKEMVNHLLPHAIAKHMPTISLK